jgi:hypothetical protein
LSDCCSYSTRAEFGVMARPVLGIVFALTALGLIASTPALADQQLAQEQAPFLAGAYGQRIVWSSYDVASKSFRLMALSNAVPTPLPIAARAQAFDVSVGPGEHGSAVAVYSRCTGKTPPPYTFGGESHASSGCDIYRYDFATGRERKVATASSTRFSETQPSIRGHRIAFVRELAPRRHKPVRNAVYVGRTTGKATVRRQPTPGSPRGGQVEGLSLTARGLLFVWRRFGVDPTSLPILTRVVNGRAVGIDRIGSGGAAYGQLLAPSVRGRNVYYGRTINGHGRIWRYDLERRSFAVGRAIRAHVVVARASGRFLLSNWLDDALCSANLFDPPTASTCTLTLTDPVRFSRHARPRGEAT